jgi:hypothetical protein
MSFFAVHIAIIVASFGSRRRRRFPILVIVSVIVAGAACSDSKCGQMPYRRQMYPCYKFPAIGWRLLRAKTQSFCS